MTPFPCLAGIVVVLSVKAMARTGLVGIELRRACCRWRVTSLALSIARWDLISTMATVPEAPL
jgi:hypothetical protein